jgi:hypothetical protein
MNLFFEVTSGAQKGTRFKIEEGLIVGRSKKGPSASPQIALDDSKVSAEHARLEKRGENWYLIDLKSSNGLKVDGKKTPELLLTAGLTVQLGRTFLKIIADEVVAPSTTKGWREDLLHLLERLEAHLAKTDDFQDARPFSPPLELKFVTGPQMGQRWILGYGPRQISNESPDFNLWLPANVISDSEVGFEIRPSAAGPLFRTASPDVVRLNGQSKTADTLKEGDTIEISGTKIEVLVWRE